MYVFLWTAAPILTTGNEFQFDDTFGTEIDPYVSFLVLPANRNKNTFGLFKLRHDIGATYNLLKMRRADLLFTLSHQNQIDWWFHTRRAHGV